MQLKNKQKGFGLVEIILGLVIAGALLGYALRMSTRAESQSIGRARADVQASFQQLASQFFYNNRSDIEAAMAGDAAKAALYCLIDVAADGTGGTNTMNATKRTCAFDSTLLRAKKLWPPGQNINLNEAGRYVAIARQVMSTDSTPVPTGADEMFVVVAQLASDGKVLTTGSATFTGDPAKAMAEAKGGMDALGGSGGYIPPGKDIGPCKYNATTKQACGNGWVVNLSDFL